MARGSSALSLLPGSPTRVVSFERKHLVERNAPSHPARSRSGSAAKRSTYPRQRYAIGTMFSGYVQHLIKRFLVENAHPADTDSFCASRKPEILHGADRRIKRSFRHGEATESMPPFALRIANDAEVLRRLKNAFEL